jgi:hypothetical protein
MVEPMNALKSMQDTCEWVYEWHCSGQRAKSLANHVIDIDQRNVALIDYVTKYLQSLEYECELSFSF